MPAIDFSKVLAYLPFNCLSNGAVAINGAMELLDSGNTGHIVSLAGTCALTLAKAKIGSTSLYTNGAQANYAQIPSHTDFSFGTGDFTVEFYVWIVSIKAYDGLISRADISATGGEWAIGVGASATYLTWYTDIDNGSYAVRTSEYVTGQWMHVAVSRTSGTTKMFIDGVEKASASDSTDYNRAINIRIGRYYIDDDAGDAGDASAYYDEFRISKGVGRYTENFTPPTTQFTSDEYTTLLLHMESQDLSRLVGATPHIIDMIGTAQLSTELTQARDFGSGNNAVTFVGTATYQTAIKKVWNASLDLDGNSDILTANGLISNLALATTGSIAGWFYCDIQDNAHNCMLYIGKDGTNTFIIATYLADAAPNLFLQCYKDSTLQWYGTTAGDSVVTGAWNHIVIRHDGSDITIYINGSSSTFTYANTTVKASWFKAVITDATGKADKFKLGVYDTNQYWYDGKIDDVRIFTDVLTPEEISTLYNSGNGTPSAIGDEVFWLKGSGVYGNGGTVLALDGNSDSVTFTSDYLKYIYASVTDSWTIQFRIKSTPSTTEQAIMCIGSLANYYFQIEHRSNNGVQVSINIPTYGAELNMYGASSALPDGTRIHHVAVIKVGTAWGVYINGVQKLSGTQSHTYTFANTCAIGQWVGSTGWLGGQVAEYLVSNDNMFSANPSAGNDTIVLPTEEYSVESGGGTETAEVSPISMTILAQDVTATHAQVVSANISPISFTITAKNVTATYVQIETAGISDISVIVSAQDVEAAYVQIDTATVIPLILNMTAQGSTAEYTQVEIASISSVEFEVSVNDATASYEQIETADVPVLNINITANSFEATYSTNPVAGILPVEMTITPQDVDATYIQVETALISSIEISIWINDIIPSYIIEGIDITVTDQADNVTVTDQADNVTIVMV